MKTFATLSIAALLLTGNAVAQTNMAVPPPQEVEAEDAEARADKLNKLFAELKRERDPDAASKISNRIWVTWGKWDDDAIDLLMRRAQFAIGERNFAAALDILDQVILLAPDHSEAWNRRATVHFLNQDFGRSIADVERTLALEPRHYGALMGLAQMMQSMGEKKEAIFALQKALDVYPAMKGPKQALIKLLEEVEGEDL